MKTLTRDEAERVLSTLRKAVGTREVEAVCAYGSRVAGYAAADSDYDAIVVLRSFRQKIKYSYISDESDCSALLVDSKSFENDCRKSSLGEFVAGRLLNCYQPLLGAEFLSAAEVEYKKRVIMEGLAQAFSDATQFAMELRFELPYFLFEKLRKRASIYPPVVYSYAKTYGEDQREDNLNFSLRAFREAAKILEQERVVAYDEATDQVRVVSSFANTFRPGLRPKLTATASFTAKSLRQYAIHGYAGRVAPVVVGREVASKLHRATFRRSRLPESILNPKLYWKLPSAELFAYTRDWIADLLRFRYGVMRKEADISIRALGELYTAVRCLKLRDKRTGKIYSLAVKQYKDVKSMKWGLLNLWSLRNTNFTVNPSERMMREYRAIRRFRDFGIRTPEAVAVFLSEKIIVTDFIPGRDLSKIEAEFLSGESTDLSRITEFGRILARLHNNKYSMGDTKPSNAILCDSDQEIYLVDLEQAHPQGNAAWDVAEFVYYSIRFTVEEQRARTLVNSFMRGYIEEAEDPDAVRRAAALRYRAPFQAFIAPNVLNPLIKDLSTAAAS